MDEITKKGGPNWKVKVYLLDNNSGNWDDCGTGTLELVKSAKTEEESDYFQVTKQDEHTNANSSSVSAIRLQKLNSLSTNTKVLLYVPISKDYQYEKQGGNKLEFYNEKDSIISWVDEKLKEEIAISFLDTTAANDIWRAICMKTKKNPLESKKYGNEEADTMVMPSLQNIEKIKQDFETKKDTMIHLLTNNLNFFDELSKLFEDAEDLQSFETLSNIYDIIRIVVFSDDLNLLETLLSDKYYLLTFGAFEYNPALSTGIKPKYREFLKNQSYYKKIIEFKDEAILNKIHQNYRISYLRDSVISTIIDDPLTNQYNTMIYYNNVMIVDHINSEPSYIEAFLNNFENNLRDSIGFLYELQNIVKNLIHVDQKLQYSGILVQNNIFLYIARALAKLVDPIATANIDDEAKNILKINLIEIISFVTQCNTNGFLTFLLSNSAESQSLVGSLISMIEYGDQGLQIQIIEFIKFLLDTNQEKKVEIQDFIYDNFFPKFQQHFKRLERNEIFYSFFQQYIEVLLFCVKSHGYRIRHYIIQQKLFQDLIKVVSEPEKTLGLALIRLLKAVVLGKDEFLIKYLAQNNIFDDIFHMYFRNVQKNNLFNSAFLELVNLPAKENIKKLINHFVERFKEQIKEHKVEKYFERLFNKYDQINEPHINESQPSENSLSEAKKNSYGPILPEGFENYNQRELTSMEDEDYFENGDDENSKEPPKKSKLEEESKKENDITAKAGRDVVLKIQSKIQKKKKEEDEDQGFPFLNKSKQKAPSTPTISNINFDLSLNSPGSISNLNFDLTLNSPTVSEKGADEFNKRPSLTSLEEDEEINKESKADIQKKQKI